MPQALCVCMQIGKVVGDHVGISGSGMMDQSSAWRCAEHVERLIDQGVTCGATVIAPLAAVNTPQLATVL